MRFHLAAIPFIVLPLTGCDSLDDFINIWSGKPSAAQVAHETAALMIPPPAAPVEEPTPEPVLVAAVVEPEPAPKPECQDLGWRWGFCDLDGTWVWY